MAEDKKDYVNALAKAHIETSKFQLKIANYFFLFILLASITLIFFGKFATAFWGFVFSGFHLLLVWPLQNAHLKRIDKNLH